LLTRRRVRLGELLVSEKVVTEEQLEMALQKQGRKKKRLGKVLIDMGLTTEEAIAAAVSRQMDIPYLDLEGVFPPPDILSLLDKDFISENLIMPIEVENGELSVAVSDPTNEMALEDASYKTGLKIRPVVCTETGVLRCMERAFRVDDHIKDIMKAFNLKEDISFLALPQDKEVDVHRRFRLTGSSQSVRMLAFIITDAFNRNASDILIEPAGDKLRLRYRILGELVNIVSLPAILRDSLIYHIKILSNLDLSNRKSPQTGKCRFTLSDRSILLEVSTIPTTTGERASIAIYDSEKPALSFKDMGLSPSYSKELLGLASEGHGLILFSGPKGNAKTTVMYAMIREIISDRLDVVTIQEHTSYKLPRATQIEMGEFSTASTLKYSTLNRPDVIMIERIDDAATAELAIQSASEGSLVLAGVVGTGPAEGVHRLLTLGADPRALSASLSGVVGLRLVKTICPSCKKIYSPDISLFDSLGLDMPQAFYHGTGCKACLKTGYRGHVHVMELVKTSGGALPDIDENTSSEEIRRSFSGLSRKSMFMSVWDLVRDGKTTVDELLRKLPPAYWPDKGAPAVKPSTTKAAPPVAHRPPATGASQTASPTSGSNMAALLSNDTFRNVMRQYRILLTLSDTHDQDKISEALLDADMQPVLATDGNHALDLMYSEDPDLLICDMRAPEMNNLLAYKKLYDEQRKYVPVILIVRGSIERYSDIDSKLGVEVKLLKPIHTKTLMGKVSDLLAQYALGE
jgi:type IV pilus assembly protein PilB